MPVRKASERTPLEWINMYTALEIRLMLKNTKLDIKEIARPLVKAKKFCFLLT